ncbi:hypothetical protein, partial [Salinibacter altiplanensis]|uniref:hypothetical protein n=1 Tax=Salinibacter altiplanensis TaxID=1803181 RepID=UPI00243424C4
GDVQAFGQHGRAVLSPFPIPCVEAAPVEVELLDPKAEGYREAQAAAAKKICASRVELNRCLQVLRAF